MLVIAGLPFTIPSIRIHLFLLHNDFNRAIGLFGVAGLLLTAVSLFLPFHPLSLVLELETHLLSLSLELGQMPKHCPFLVYQPGTLSSPSQPSSLVHFHVNDDDDF